MDESTLPVGMERKELSIYYGELMHEKRELGLAYVLWFLMGWIGAHQFYLGRRGRAYLYLGLGVAPWVLVPLGWMLLGRKLIPGLLTTYKSGASVMQDAPAGIGRFVLSPGGLALSAATVAWLLLVILLVWDFIAMPKRLARDEQKRRRELRARLTPRAPQEWGE